MKKLIEFADLSNCSNVKLDKKLGAYNLETSAMKETKYIKNNSKNKTKMESYDD